MISRSSRFVTVSVWLLAALGAASAGAQQPGAPAWLRARLEGRLDAKARTAVEHVIDSAYTQGVPAEPLVDRALEGASKSASADAIVRSVRKLASELVTARQALGTASLADELSAGAAALRVGVETKSLQRLRTDRPGQPLTVTLGVLCDLIGRGVPVASATENVFKLTKAGAADEQLVAFRRDVDRDVGIGAAPAAAALLRQIDLTRNLAIDGPGGGGSSVSRPVKPRP